MGRRTGRSPTLGLLKKLELRKVSTYLTPRLNAESFVSEYRASDEVIVAGNCRFGPLGIDFPGTAG